ncbi:TetR/AcrR family transcriptional regulator [Promicromonospora citrea]|uniref:TetR family transcriptional regulator n=1 Tax=Promicromonospora citrea TaxID=43677 RepID=A0A8H9GIP2_9MICO|nr:TetR/AcrR family transcriptional regulator [Promicromonospora citrea]NNH52515.1 TetR/AcrR family transcriptional regulator [Promicromonospora citrea]GGM30771.1 TetR family transcriptional regulator [Promicromonospora citrea]
MSTSPPSTRDRILDAATDLFYAHGIRAVSADKIIERAGITKVTFYRHFRTKDALVVAYLERQAARERAALDELRAAADGPAQAFHTFAHVIGAEACKPGFRGCSFINAAAEYAEPASPVRVVVAEHRAWYRRTFAEMLTELGVPDAERAAGELMMLRDGAMLAGYLGDPAQVADSLDLAISAVVESRGTPARA